MPTATPTRRSAPAGALELHAQGRSWRRSSKPRRPSRAAPAGALELHEAVAAKPSPLADDGTVLVHIIRPGLGLGRGNHHYPADMLQENAHKFSGWRVYVDHLSADAKKALGGLPRSMRDLGGMVQESWWDPSVPASGRHEAGAVVGRVRPIRELREVVEELPEAVEFSIRAKATDVHQDVREGKSVWVVEGIRDQPGSVDAVTEAGAGGKIVEIIEGLNEATLLQESREVEEGAQTKLKDNDFAIPEGRKYPIHDQGGDDVKQLEEALRDPQSGVARAISEIVDERVQTQVDEKMGEREEQHQRDLQEAREESRVEATAETGRQLALRDLREQAHELIEGARLPETLTERLRGEYDITENKPAAKLDITDEVDDWGKVVTTAATQLQESVERDIREQRELMAELNPTAVRGQGTARIDGDASPKRAEAGSKPYYQEFLEEAGVDPEAAFSGVTSNSTTEKESE